MPVHEFTISSVFAQGIGVCHTDIIWSTNLENFLGKDVTIGIYEVHVASDETRFQTHFTYLLISRNMGAEFYSPIDMSRCDIDIYRRHFYASVLRQVAKEAFLKTSENFSTS